MSGQFVYGGDFRFSYLLIKYRKVSGSDDTRKPFESNLTRVRIPFPPPIKTQIEYESVRFRFFFAKFRHYLCFSGVRVPSFQSFRDSYGCVRITLSVAVADSFMPRKVLDVRKECVRLSCQRQTKSPFGAVDWRFICLPTRSAEAHVKNTVE